VPLKFIGAGASSDDLNWTRGFFASMREKGEGIFNRIHGWGVHHYSWNVSGGRTNDWNAGKGDAVKFDTEQYYELLSEADKLEKFLGDHWNVMGEFDTKHRVKIAVDEWGSWHRPGTELKPEHTLGQQNTMRDALVAALTLDIFNRNADKVMMGNVAQLANCLHSLFLTDGDKFLLTPTYHVFEMFVPHMSAQSVRMIVNAPKIGYERNGKPAEIWSLNGSASVNGKQCTLTLSNPHMQEPREVTVNIRGQKIASATSQILAASDVHSHNTFTDARMIEPRTGTVTVKGANAVIHLPPASVASVQIKVG
jgi:alpha-N-arabinofuranosidase